MEVIWVNREIFGSRGNMTIGYFKGILDDLFSLQKRLHEGSFPLKHDRQPICRIIVRIIENRYLT